MAASIATLGRAGVLALLFACSSGGSSGGGDAPDDLSLGAITSVGSAVVVGTDWEIPPEAVVTFDGEPGLASDLAPGMTVRVGGRRTGETGTADSVAFEDAIEGPVDAVDPDPMNPERLTLAILGRNVLVERGYTIFAGGIDFDTVAPGNVVEVSGYDDGEGTITASRVEFVSNDASPVVELIGVVEALDTVGSPAVFSIGSIDVEFDTDTQLPDGTPEEGDRVEVLGVFDGGSSIDATSDMDEIRRVPPEQGDVAEFEMEGVVSGFTNRGDFFVNDQPVNAAGFGIIFQPANPAFLADGARVQVEGRLDDGLLLASSVSLRSGEVRIEAEVAPDAIDAEESTLLLLGEITLEFDASTRFEAGDGTGGAGDCPDFDAIEEGGFVSVRGVRIGTAQLLATEIDCQATGDEIVLVGRVEGFDDNQDEVLILGVRFPVNVGTMFSGFPDPGVSSPDEFFPFLAANANALLEVVDLADGDATELDVADAVAYAEEDEDED